MMRKASYKDYKRFLRCHGNCSICQLEGDCRLAEKIEYDPELAAELAALAA